MRNLGVKINQNESRLMKSRPLGSFTVGEAVALIDCISSIALFNRKVLLWLAFLCVYLAQAPKERGCQGAPLAGEAPGRAP